MMTAPRLPERHESPMDLPFSLARTEGLEHVLLNNGQQILRVEDGIPYPDYEVPSMMHEVLLKPSPQLSTLGKREFLLPENYVTLGQALNDAIGYAGSQASVELATELFAELGVTLAQIANVDKQVPKELHYSQIIFQRENMGFQILPPLEVKNVTYPLHDQEAVTESLWDSLDRAAVTKYQRRMAAMAFKGFTDWFKLG